MSEKTKPDQAFELHNSITSDGAQLRELPELEVRPAKMSDVSPLDKSMPSAINVAQIAAQEKGDTTFLLAFDGDEPVGRLVIGWGGTTRDEIREWAPNTPNISMVRTREDQRGRGVGTKLIQSAENLARMRGYGQMGLSVALENKVARRLYERLGYENWGHGAYRQPRRMPGPNGETMQTEIYLIKQLTAEKH